MSQVQPTADDVPEVLGQVGSLYFESLVSFLQASADSIVLLNRTSYLTVAENKYLFTLLLS